MAVDIPPLIQPLLDAYLNDLEPLRDHLYGIYIYGSIALGAFEELESDIDIIVLTQGEWSPLELKQLETIHTRLNKEYPLGKRLEVLYAPLRYLGIVHPGKATVAYPARWQKLIDEAWRIRQHLETPSLYSSPITRMGETLAFIKYVRTRHQDFLS